MTVDLHLDPDELNSCVQCGLCLPHCPTFRVTGDEALSPRGRIALFRQVQNGGAPITDEVVDAFATCVQCRGCEPACPSAVPYGRLMERTRESLVDAGLLTPWWQRLALENLTRPRLLRAGSLVLALAQRLRLVPRRLGLPARIPLRRAPLAPSPSAVAATTASGRAAVTEPGEGPVDGPVWLFTGCVMDAWQRPVHQAAQRVLEASGLAVVPTGGRAPCCGALHLHAGLGRRARILAADTLAVLDDGRPVVVDSAGCGAALQDYGHLLGTPAAERFSLRVVDVAQILAERIGRLPDVRPLPLRVAVQDPCHLRHVQQAHLPVRTLLAPFVAEVVELDDQGLCCGAGGAYSVLQPDLAGDIRDRKLDAIARADVDLVVSGNPGCTLHLAATGLDVVHPVEVVDRALRA